MALIEQTMTEKNLAARRRNARFSQGAATPEGKERARGANLRHGYYSQLRDQALEALGENPAELAALLEGAREQYRPANAHQAWIADRLARLQWRIDRAERMQESRAATHLRQIEAQRREAAGKLRQRGAEVQDFLDSVRRAVARSDFYAPTLCFERCGELMEQSPSSNMEEIVGLLHQLRRPNHFTEPPPPPLPDAMSDPEWQENIDSELADESSLPDPEVAPAEGSERDPLRQRLWELAAEELRLATERWQKAIAAQEAPLSTRARDIRVLEISEEMELMRREERSCVREFLRLGNDLRKLQKASEVPQHNSEAKSRDQAAPVQASGPEGTDEESQGENEAASGYVEENTEDRNYVGATKCPSDAGQPLPEALEPDEDLILDLVRGHGVEENDRLPRR